MQRSVLLQMAAAHRIFRSAFVVSCCTLCSRVLGLARDVICASVFGDRWVWDIFCLAFRVPNLFRRLFGEGAMSAAFVPVLTEYLERRDKAEAWQLVSVAFTFLLTVLAVIVVVGEALFWGLSAGAAFGPRGMLALKLLGIMFPYVLLICLVALAMAVLNSLDHFFTPAFAPVVLNVCWITGVLVLAPAMGDTPEERIVGVAIAVLVAGVIQLGIQVPALRAKGVRLGLCFDFSHPGLRRSLRLMGPVVFGLAIMQCNVLLDSLIAVGFARPPDGPEAMSIQGFSIPYPLESGANAVLYYGDRLMQFPLGVFGIAMAAAALPTFARLAARDDRDGLVAALNHTFRVILFIGIPASVGLVVLRRPIVELLYQRNAFTQQAADRTSLVVMCYSLGVWAYCGVHVLVRAFHALQDTRTPVKVGASMVAANICLNLTLIWFLREGGLALATAICSAGQLLILYWLLVRRIGRGDLDAVCGCTLKTVAASAAMALTCLWSLSWLDLPARLTMHRCIRVFVPMALGGSVFVAVSWLLRVPELGDTFGAVAARLPLIKGIRRPQS